jgi:hypothetical protein
MGSQEICRHERQVPEKIIGRRPGQFCAVTHSLQSLLLQQDSIASEGTPNSMNSVEHFRIRDRDCRLLHLKVGLCNI